LFDGLVAVFVGHHGNDHNGQEQFKKCRNKGIEVPDVGKVENTLIGQVELYRSDVELDGRDQCDGGQKHKIGDDQDLAGPIVPQFYEFYLE